ncbi:MAG: tetratricopeptide repeat protein [Gemmatimonadota bacterium]
MHRTLTNRRRAVIFSLLLVGTGFVTVHPAQAQDPAPAQPSASRFRVLIPMLERRGEVRSDFGKKVAENVAKSIDKLPTHEPVDPKEMKESLRKFKLKEEELDCIKNRQLAVQMNAELVMCGQYEAAAGGGLQVGAQFISAKTGETFEVAPFTATDPAQAAQHIYSSFENYVKQISLAAFCADYLASQQWPNALENCNQALLINPNSQIALMGKGMALYRMGMSADQTTVTDSAKLREAEAVYKQVLALNPVHQDALRQSGIIAARLGNAVASREYFRQYMELNPGDVGVRLAIAAEAQKNGDPEGALRIVEEGLANDSTSVDLNTYAGHFAIAAAGKAEADNADKAAPFFELAAKYYGRVYTAHGNETDPIVLQNYVLALLKLPGREQEAVDVGTRAVAAKPGEAGVWMAYASALQATGKLDEALAAVDTALARDPKTTRATLRKAQWLLAGNRLNEAIPAFQDAIQRGDVDAEAATNLVFREGFEKYRANSFDAAIDYFTAARSLAPDAKSTGMANFWIGMVHYQRGIAAAKPQTKPSARAALPHFQRAQTALQSEGVSAYASSTQGVNLGQTLSAVRQYIDIQNQIINR